MHTGRQSKTSSPLMEPVLIGSDPGQFQFIDFKVLESVNALA